MLLAAVSGTSQAGAVGPVPAAKIQASPEGGYRLEFRTDPGWVYQLQSSSNLADWTDWGDPVEGNTGPAWVVETPAQNRQFFRLERGSPPLAVAGLSFSEPCYTVTEDARSTQVEILRFGPTDGALVVSYQLVGETAGESLDFVGGSGSLVFAPGEQRRSLLIELLPDALPEDDELFHVVIESVQPEQVLFPHRSAQLLIADDDDDGGNGGGENGGVRTLFGCRPLDPACRSSSDGPHELLAEGDRLLWHEISEWPIRVAPQTGGGPPLGLVQRVGQVSDFTLRSGYCFRLEQRNEGSPTGGCAGAVTGAIVRSRADGTEPVLLDIFDRHDPKGDWLEPPHRLRSGEIFSTRQMSTKMVCFGQ